MERLYDAEPQNGAETEDAKLIGGGGVYLEAVR